ncbi:adenylate/guanylate cyclase domain-containing protein [Maridesulfovibrio sp. FT414]|uniref:adenylate/guanylate cyclase domain-containing protein n=1 Tax=Maridesulfovibrio sp. FT414 TaxID=2979469 RepID=UPI003D800F8C
MTDSRHVAIIFTDLKGFSGIDDTSYAGVHKLNSYIEESVLNPLSPLKFKTWGDAISVYFGCCADAAEAALRIRDYIRTCPWKKYNLLPLPIRIGVHFARITVMHGENGIEDIVGKGVSAGARIEPIVEPDKVYCSGIFRENLIADKDTRFTFVDLGKMELAKNFGTMNMYELLWKHEQKSTSSQEIIKVDRGPLLKVPIFPRKITDIDRKDFVDRSFSQARTLFQNMAVTIQEKRNDIFIDVQDVDNMRFIAGLYINGDLEHQTKIWIGGAFSTFSISCSDGVRIDPHSSNSFNECLILEDDDSELFFKAQMALFGVDHLGLDFNINRMNIEQTSIYLWQRFIKNL